MEKRTAELLGACERGDQKAVERLTGASSFSKAVDVDSKNEYGNSPLIKASEKDFIEIARVLIARGADVNCRNKDGETPLLLASKEGFTATAGLLIENGADVNAKDGEGNTPLRLAARGDYKELVDLLVENGADVDAASAQREAEGNPDATNETIPEGGEFGSGDAGASIGYASPSDTHGKQCKKTCFYCGRRFILWGHSYAGKVFCSMNCVASYRARVGFCEKCIAETTSESAGNMRNFNNIGTGLGMPKRKSKCPICGSVIQRKWGLFLIPIVPYDKYRVIELRIKIGFGQSRTTFLSRKLKMQ